MNKLTTIQKIQMFAIMIVITILMALTIYWFAKEEIRIIVDDGLFEAELVIAPELELKAPKDKILKSKEVDWIIKKEDGTIENKGKIITYDYISDVEVKNDVDEDVSMRTGNVKFFKRKILGAESNEEVIEAHFYIGTPFIKEENDKWYYSETATTTIKAFEEQIEESFRGSGDPIYPGAGDGWTSPWNYFSWDASHDHAGDYNIYNGAEGFITGWNYSSGYEAYRSLFPIDTSAIPSNAVITAAIFSVYGKTLQGTPSGVVVQTTQASNTALENADYTKVGDAIDNPTEGSNRDTSMDVDAYNDFTLDSTGRGWVKKSGEASTCGDTLTGWTCLGIRDLQDVDDETGTASGKYLYGYFSEETGTDKDPKLVVTYTEVLVSPQGQLQIKSGRFQVQ